MTIPFFFDDGGAVGGGVLSLLFNADVTELIESVDADFVVLAELQPMEPLIEWTAMGVSFPNTYWCQFPSQIATDVVQGGLYRRLDEVRQNDVALTPRLSSGEVDLNLGSYYLDPNGILFVSTTTGAHPDTYALIGAWFTLFFSTTSIRFSDYPLYSPMLTGTFPVLSNEMPDPMSGSIVTDSGALEILNTDGMFDKMAKRYVWRNKKVTFKLGGRAIPYTSFETFDRLQINNISVTDESFTLQLESGGSVLNKTLPLRTWGDGTMTGAVTPVSDKQGVTGLLQPIVLGAQVVVPCVFAGIVGEGDPFFVGTVSEAFYIHDANSGPYGSISAQPIFFAIDRNSKAAYELTLGVDGFISGAELIVTNTSYPHDTYDMVVIATQLGTVGSGPFFGTMAKALLELCGESSDNINAGAFAAANAECPTVLARLLSEAKSGVDWMSELEQSVNGQVYKDSDGRWVCRLLRPDVPTEYITLRDEDFVSWEPNDDVSASLNEFRVRYNHIPYGDEWSEATASDDRTRYENETSDSHRIDTWIEAGIDDAQEHAHHRLFFQMRPPIIVESEQRTLWLMKHRAGDQVAVVRDRGPIERTGRLDGQMWRIRKIEKSLGPTPSIRVWLEDLGGQTDRIGRCLDADVDLDWANATPQQRAIYGFCSDDSGYLGDAFNPGGRYAKVAY